MSNNSLTRVALIDPIETNRTTIRNVLQAMDDSVIVEAECNKYDQADFVVSEFELDAVIINLDANHTQSANLLGHINQHNPNLCIVAISNDPGVLLQAHRKGAQHLLENPIQVEHLINIIQHLGNHSQDMRPKKGQVISILPSRGGLGATTIATNLACTLANDKTNKVAIVDLDFITGAIDVALGLDPRGSLIDIVSNIEQLTIQNVKNAITEHNSGVSVITRPIQHQDLGQIHEEHIQRLLRLLQSLYSYTIVDLSKGWLTTDIATLHMSDKILLVVQPEITGIRNASLLMNTLIAENLSSKVSLVISRNNANYGSGLIDTRKIEEHLCLPVFHTIPNDYKVTAMSWAEGKPLIQIAPNSKIQGSINNLVAKLQKVSKTNTNGVCHVK